MCILHLFNIHLFDNITFVFYPHAVFKYCIYILFALLFDNITFVFLFTGRFDSIAFVFYLQAVCKYCICILFIARFDNISIDFKQHLGV